MYKAMSSIPNDATTPPKKKCGHLKINWWGGRYVEGVGGRERVKTWIGMYSKKNSLFF